LSEVFTGHKSGLALFVLAAVLDAWASDASSLDEQWAAVRNREEAVESEKRVVVGVVGMANAAQQDLASAGTAHSDS
jgi:hypothetical protein